MLFMNPYYVCIFETGCEVRYSNINNFRIDRAYVKQLAVTRGEYWALEVFVLQYSSLVTS